MANLNFDARSVEPNKGTGDPLPAGWYVSKIIESEMKPTKAGDGAYLALTMEIMAPASYVGRKVFTNLNLRNPNPVAQEIAYKDLSAICHATGVIQVNDSQQLHGIPMKIRLKLRKATEDFEASNDVTAYRNVNENVTLVADGAPVGSSASGGFAPPAPPAPPTGGFGQAPTQPAQQPAQRTWQQPQPPQQPAQQPQQPQQNWQQPAQQPPAQQPAPVQQPAQQPAQPWQQPQQTAPVQQPQQPAQQPQQPAPPPGYDPNAVPAWAQQQPQG